MLVSQWLTQSLALNSHNYQLMNTWLNKWIKEQANKWVNGRVNQKAPAEMTNKIEIIIENTYVLEIWQDINFTTHLLLQRGATILAESVFIFFLFDGGYFYMLKDFSKHECIVLCTIGDNNRVKNIISSISTEPKTSTRPFLISISRYPNGDWSSQISHRYLK